MGATGSGGDCGKLETITIWLNFYSGEMCTKPDQIF